MAYILAVDLQRHGLSLVGFYKLLESGGCVWEDNIFKGSSETTKLECVAVQDGEGESVDTSGWQRDNFGMRVRARNCV